MDAGAGMLEVLRELPAPTTVLCDVQTTLYDAPRVFGPQKGATAEQVMELERRFRALDALGPYADLPGSGAAGGLGAALASLGAELVQGAAAVVELAGFDAAGYGLVVTGEGRVDATTAEGKVVTEVVSRCGVAGVPCVVFGGVVEELVPGAETIALSGDPARAARDLFELGLRLGTRLLAALPERECLVERRLALLEPLHDLLELGLRLLERLLLGAHGRVSSTRAANAPSASSTSTRVPAASAEAFATTCESIRTIA